MSVDRNWQTYVSLNQRKYAGRYVVIVDGKVVGSGKGRRLLGLVARARKQYPKKIPFIAKIRDPRTLCIY